MADPAKHERAIFEAALELTSAGQRRAYVSGACGTDAELRERVEALVRAHEEAGGFLPEDDPYLAAAAGGAVRMSSTLLPVTEKPGDRIGRYKLREKVGEGGCGVVYVAEQEEPVRRRVALKVIKLGMDSRSVVARFEAERQALAMMDHPNIAKVLDAGATETGRPFFVMELVRGIKITEYCDQNKLSMRERLDLFIKVCQAVQHAHQKGLIHRDIKPSNILVTLHDGVPVPKIIDFGIAKATEGRLTDLTVYTQLHQFIGTPAYMSPEQAEMSGLDIDTRSDIYSLGVLLYELLTGVTPFDGQTLLQSGLDEMRRIIREDEPKRPSTRLSTLAAASLSDVAHRRHTEAPKLMSLIRGDLDWIVMKALEKDRTRRYESANGLAADLKSHLNHEPVVARPPSNIYRFQKLVRRNKLAFTAGTAVATALIVGLGLSTWLFLRERATSKVAAGNALRAEQHAQRAEQKSAESRRNLYAADMILAQAALETGNIGRAKELLRKYLPQPGEKDLRGWEWRYAWNQCRSDELFTLGSHEGIVTTLALSTNGRILASGSYDGTVVLWDLPKKQRLRTLLQSAAVGCVAFGNGGKELIAGVHDGQVSFWNCETGQRITTLSNGSSALSLKVSPNEKTLAVIGRRFLTIWNLAHRQEVARLDVLHDNSVPVGVTFSPDSSLLAYSKGDGTIVLWDLAKAIRVAELKGHEQFVCSLAFSPTGSILVSGGFDKTVRVWDITSRQEIKRMSTFSGWVGCVEFSPDGEVLAVAGADQRINLLETRTWGEINTVRGHSDEVWKVVFAPDTRTIITCSKDLTIRCWALPLTGERDSRQLPADVNVISLLPGAQRLYLMHTNRTYSLWRTDSFEETTRYDFPEPHCTASTVSPDGFRWAGATTNGSVRIFARDKGFVADLPSVNSIISRLAYSLDGEILASVQADHTCRLWSVARRQELAVFAIHAQDVTCLRFSRSGRLLLIGYEDGVIEIWHVATGSKVAVLRGHKSRVTDIAVTLDDTTLATANAWYATIKVWDLRTTTEIAVFGGQLRAFHCLVFSADDTRLAACGGDGFIRLWDMETKQEVASIKIHRFPIHQLAFSRDDDHLVAAGDDRVFVLRATKY